MKEPRFEPSLSDSRAPALTTGALTSMRRFTGPLLCISIVSLGKVPPSFLAPLLLLLPSRCFSHTPPFHGDTQSAGTWQEGSLQEEHRPQMPQNRVPAPAPSPTSWNSPTSPSPKPFSLKRNNAGGFYITELMWELIQVLKARSKVSSSQIWLSFSFSLLAPSGKPLYCMLTSRKFYQ